MFMTYHSVTIFMSSFSEKNLFHGTMFLIKRGIYRIRILLIGPFSLLTFYTCTVEKHLKDQLRIVCLGNFPNKQHTPKRFKLFDIPTSIFFHSISLFRWKLNSCYLRAYFVIFAEKYLDNIYWLPVTISQIKNFNWLQFSCFRLRCKYL